MAKQNKPRPWRVEPLPPDPAHKARFDRLCTDALREHHIMGEAGIGTLGEKRLHSLIKRFLCEDSDYHEVGVANTRFVADVWVGDEILEVQTGPFYPMQKKIAHYMEKTEHTVTVVHPILWDRTLSWVDLKRGTVEPARRAPKEYTEALLPELYCLIPYLNNPRLRVRLLYLEARDFKTRELLKGRRRSVRRFDCLPLSLLGERLFASPEDYACFVPPELPDRFTVSDYSEHTGVRGRDAYSAVRVLSALGLLRESGKEGRAMAFEKTQKNSL